MMTPPPVEQTQSQEALLLDLVNAKTAEAVARQELEETKGKLDALRKIISGGAMTPTMNTKSEHSSSASIFGTTPPSATAKTPEMPKPATHAHAPSTSSVGGFFSGWGKRT